MVYNGTCRHSSYLNDITVWKDVTRMILSNDFSIYESRQCLAPVHQCQCSPKAYEAVVDTIECGEKLCLCVVEAFAKIATSVGNTGQVKPANTASTVLGMLAHGNKNDILKLVLENKDLNVNFAPSASETALSYSLLCPHRVHMHYFVEYLDYNDVLYDSDSGYDSEMEIPSLDDSWENASLDTLKMLLGHPRINVNESSAIYIAASRNLFEHLKLLRPVVNLREAEARGVGQGYGCSTETLGNRSSPFSPRKTAQRLFSAPRTFFLTALHGWTFKDSLRFGRAGADRCDNGC